MAIFSKHVEIFEAIQMQDEGARGVLACEISGRVVDGPSVNFFDLVHPAPCGFLPVILFCRL